MYHNLPQHPRVWMPPVKELMYKLRYMAAERAIVASDLPSMREIVGHGRDAWRVEPGDQFSLFFLVFLDIRRVGWDLGERGARCTFLVTPPEPQIPSRLRSG